MQISITGIKARDKALKGAKYVADAVKSTIGPFGQNALLEKGNKITNDGYLISQNLCPTIDDVFERRGALVGHEASAKTNDMVGDATSSAWALEDAIATEAVRYLPSEKSLISKKTPSEVRAMISQAKEQVLEKLASMATPIADKDTLVKSALVSVEDATIAQLLGEMQFELGPDGIIIAEETNAIYSSIEKVNGIRLDNGFSTYAVITNEEKQSLEVDNIPILLTNSTIGTAEMQGLTASIFNHLISQKKWGIVLVARAFTAEALQLCQDTSKKGFGIFPVNAPYVNQKEIMRDLGAVTGARYIDTEETRFEDIYITDIGFTKRFIARASDGIVTGIDDEQSKVRIEKRVAELQQKLSGEKSDFGKKMLETRLAQLTSGFAILKVGSHSVINRKRLKDKCDDAVNAVRLALKGGTVKGAGLAFKEISEALDEDNILKRPITVINDVIMASAPKDFVVEDWVRDPFLVLKCALENACDVASTLATVNIVVAEENKPKCNCGSIQSEEE